MDGAKVLDNLRGRIKKCGPRSDYKEKCLLSVWQAIGYLPVCRWLHVATSVMKCRVRVLMKGWYDTQLKKMIMKTVTRVKQSNPA